MFEERPVYLRAPIHKVRALLLEHRLRANTKATVF